jgi:hypothetical protein
MAYKTLMGQWKIVGYGQCGVKKCDGDFHYSKFEVNESNRKEGDYNEDLSADAAAEADVG